MLSKEQLAEYRPDYRIRFLVRLAVVLLVLVCCAFVVQGLRAEPMYHIVVLVLAFSVFMLVSLTRFGPMSLSDAWERHKMYTRIGYQVIWQLDKNGRLDNRVERRDHQNATLNTSEWVVYERLGGPNRGMSIARRDERNSPFAVDASWVNITRISDYHVHVRGADGFYLNEQVLLESLLTVLNRTGGHLGDLACNELIRQLDESRRIADQKSASLQELLVTVEGLKRELKETDDLKSKALTTLARAALDAGNDRDDARAAENALAAIVSLANKRGTRVSDIRDMASQELGAMLRKRERREITTA